MEGCLVESNYVNQKGFKGIVFRETNSDIHRIFTKVSIKHNVPNPNSESNDEFPYVIKTYFKCSGLNCLCKATAYSLDNKGINDKKYFNYKK